MRKIRGLKCISRINQKAAMGNEARIAARDFRSVFMRLRATFLIAKKIISILSLVNIIVLSFKRISKSQCI